MAIWNNHQGAVSLTFDDGMYEQWRYAVPELDRYGMKGTFFLVQSPEKTPRKYDTMFRSEEWRAAALAGHEIGGHSITHMSVEDMQKRPEEANYEIISCKSFIEQALNVRVTSYAYPYTYSNQEIVKATKQAYQQARGMTDCYGENRYLKFGENRDIFNLPSFQTNDTNITLAESWFDQAVARQAWIVLMFHGIGPNNMLYDNIPTEKFAALLENLATKDIWVAPFGIVAEYYRQNSLA